MATQRQIVADFMSESQRVIADLLDEPLELVFARERNLLGDLLAEHDFKLVLFGAGSIGRRAVPLLNEIGIRPLAFSDNNSALWGQTVEGIPVLAPPDAARQFGAYALFLVSIWNEQNMFRNTRNQLRSLGCRSVSPVAPLFWRFGSTYLPNYSQDYSHRVFQQGDDVVNAAGLWSDHASRSEFLAHIRWRACGDPGELTTADSTALYFPADLFDLSANEVFVDCGAYDGDTARQFLECRIQDFQHVHLIEANERMLPALRKFTASFPASDRAKITLHSFAVGAERGTLRFNSNNGVNSCLDEQGDSVVEMISLDEVLDGAAVSLVKMDIEGAEFDALTGAHRSIMKYRPVLAICVYHKQDDIWRIPNLVSSFAPDYRFYLRTYDGDGWQSVMYAVPAERAKKAGELD